MEEEGIGFKARFVSMLLRLITLGLIVVALSISTEGIVVVLLLFVLVVPFEKLFPRHRAKRSGARIWTPMWAMRSCRR